MTGVDTVNSRFQELASAKDEFNRAELRRCRLMLRRLRYLDEQIDREGGLANARANGGAAWAEWEVEALEWVLTEIGFLETRQGAKQ